MIDAVAEPHHGMHDRLRMHQHLDLLGVNVEERLRLDHLQRLVEHRGAVDRDPLAHVPVRMRPRLRPASPSPSAPRVQSRNGPPEAVRMMPLDLARRARRAAPGRWRCARCRPGCSRVPCAAQVRRSSSPAQTRLSLLASASTPPCRASRRPGASPAAPTIADIAQSTGSAAAAQQRLRPRRRRDAAAGERRRELGQPRRRRRSPRPAPRAAAPARRAARRCRRRSAPRPRRRSAPALRRRCSDDRVAPDRAGRPEDADPPPHRSATRTCRCRGRRRSRRTRRRP